MSAPDRLSEIRERLATATAGPWTFRIWPPAESGCDAEAELRDPAGEVVAAAVGERANVEVIAHGRADLGWAVEEIDYLRRRHAALSHFSFCQDGLIWALADPENRNVERKRELLEEARAALREIPLYREGECERGCRRAATHVLVIEHGGAIRRQRRCQDCGREGLRARRVAIAAGVTPADEVRLEPITEGDRA